MRRLKFVLTVSFFSTNHFTDFKTMKIFFSTLLLFFLLFTSTAQTFELQTQWWQPNGSVKTIAIDSTKNIAYIGGNFNYIGPEQAFAVQLNSTEPNYPVNIPLPNGSVLCSASDGNGGWYIGGDFTKVGDSIRNHLAHISNTGIVTNWNPNPTSSISTPQIKSIVKKNQIIYVGGQFTGIGGTTRQSIAALDASTGLATSWNANLSSAANVTVIKINGPTVYVAGNNITTQSAMAALNINTGQLTSWAPKVSGYVNDIAIKNDTIIICGTLYQINNSYCSSVAAIDAAGQMINWYLELDNVVRAMILKDNFLVIGGDFTALNIEYPLKYRNHLARIDMSTGLVDDWNPNVNERIVSMAINNNNLFLTGEFTKIGTSVRYRIAALDFYTGVPTDWDFDADATVSTVSFSNNSMFIGGYFSSIGGQDRNLIASMDLLSGQTTDWNPSAYGTSVNAIAVYNDLVYVGGEFYSMGGKQRENLAELNYSSNIATDFNTSAGNSSSGVGVYALVVSNDRLYVGGNFLSIGYAPSSSRIAVINLLSKSILSNWKPNADGTVRCIAVDGDTVYVGGSFANIGGQQRMGIAALDISSGLATDWNPNYMNSNWYPNSNSHYISSLAVSPSAVFVGGNFYTIGNNSARNSIASIYKTSGLVTNWRATTLTRTATGAIKLLNDKLYIGSRLSGFETPLEIHDTIYGWEENSYSKIIDGDVYCMQFYHNKLFMGGQFMNSFDTPRKGFAVFNTCSLQYYPTVELSENYICPGSQAVLSITNANSATTWKWYANNCAGTPLTDTGDNIEVSPSANTTTYYVKGSGGCVNTVCQSKTIYLKMPAFKPTVTIRDNTLITDEVTDGSFQWIDCETNLPIPNTDATSYSPIVNGNYEVTLTQYGCSSTSDCIPVTFLENPTPTIASTHLSTIKIYPNPTNGAVFLDFGQPVQSGNVSVINSLGECIFSTNIKNETSIHLNFDNQSSGLFVIIVEKEGGNESVKLIKQ